MTRRFTGWHMATILVAFFGVVIAVNLIMARYASSTFGGIVVENSYVASQEFNGWLDAAKDQEKLGWDAVTTWRPDGRLAVAVRGPGEDVNVSAEARHPLGRLPDIRLEFTRNGNGRFVSKQSVPDGRWVLRLEVRAEDRTWRREEMLQ